MKKNLLLISISLISISGQYSCSKKPDDTSSPSAQANALHSIQKKTGSYEASPSLRVKWSDGYYSLWYAHTAIDNHYEIKLYTPLHLHENTLIGTYNTSANAIELLSSTGILYYQHGYQNPNTNQSNGYPGDCSLLGPKKVGESFSDCFERNFDNFCCDLTGCLAITLVPKEVLIAIAISCGFKAHPIYEIYDLENNEVLYN